MQRTVGLGVIILALSCSCFIAAGEEEVLSWQDCLQEALANHPDLISAREELNQALASKIITASSSRPQISGSLGAKTARASSGAETDTYSYDVTGKQLLFDGRKTAQKIASAEADLKAAEYSYQVTSSNIRLNLETAFTQLLEAQELLDISQQISARRRENVELVELRYQAGREHKGSLLNAQANLAQAEFEVIQAQRDIRLSQRRLINELGREELTPIRVRGELEIVAYQQQLPDFEALAENNPFLSQLIAKKEAARFDLNSARADFFPEVYANASAGRTDAHWPPHNETWSAGVTLSLPIFEGGSRLAEVSKAEAALGQARADEKSGKDSVLFTLENTWKSWQDAVDTVGVKKKFLQAAEERAKIAQAQYSIGLISFDDWSIIEDNLVSAKKNYLTAKADALVERAGWIQAKGGTLDYAEK